MNRDTVVASGIGFGLGLVAAIALWVVPRILPQNETVSPQPEEVVEKSTLAATDTQEGLTINSPTDGFITDKNTITVTGSLPASNFIAVSTANENQVVISKADGKFSADMELLEGGNEIIVTGFVHERPYTKHLFVYFFTEEP